MEQEKKTYETPEVTKVEFDATDRITASASRCTYFEPDNLGVGGCWE